MDLRVAGAGGAMALAFMLLIPTFNALNNSYVENVTPPPWLPTPDEIPENFRPPPDMKPPEGWEPPPDMEPPPGWEPPPGYDGPIPPGGCPPPVIRHIDAMNQTGTIDPQWTERTFQFTPPRYTVALVANVTFTSWQAQRVLASLEIPDGETMEDSREGNTGGLLVPATTQPPAEFVFQLIAEDESTMPPEGTYTLSLDVDIPISGRWKTEAVVAIACGGLLE